MVAGKEDMLLARVPGGQGYEEVDDTAGVRATVAVVAEKDDEGGVEIGLGDASFEIRPK